MIKGKGARRSASHQIARLAAVRAPLGASLPVYPPAASLLDKAPPRMDQGSVNSCTGHGGSGAAFTACASKGIPLAAPPSPRLLYADARCHELPPAPDGSLPSLRDEGATIADVVFAYERCGVGKAIQAPTSDGRYSDVEPANVDVRPTLADDEASAADLLVGARVIPVADPFMPGLLAAALASGCPILVGCDVDSRFESYGDSPKLGVALSGKVDPSDPNGGGHCMFVVAHRTEVDGTLSFLLVNSWSAEWCDDGTIWVTEEWLRSALWEAYAIDATLRAAA